MKTVRAGVLDIAYFEAGPADGQAVVLIHGFPYDAHAFDEVSPLLAAKGLRCYVPFMRGYGATRFRSAETPRSGQQAAFGADLLAFMDALSIRRAILGGYDWGGRAACVVAALWPERVAGLVSCGRGYNIFDPALGSTPAAPADEARLWYMYYFNTHRGVVGLTRNRHALCRHIWTLWSPTWRFSDATYDLTAAAFDNPDFVEVVIHSYRQRIGAAAGDPALEAIERRLAEKPRIAVPTIVLHGQDDGVDPPSAEDFDRRHFSAGHERRIVPGTGHNLPQEAPAAFASAVLSLAQS